MAHSIEARVPFLDHRVVEFAFRLPGSLKIKGVETKHVLREAMRGVLPEDIRARKDKIGFRAEPDATWMIAERHRDSIVENEPSTRSSGSPTASWLRQSMALIAQSTRNSCSGGLSTRSSGFEPTGGTRMIRSLQRAVHDLEHELTVPLRVELARRTIGVSFHLGEMVLGRRRNRAGERLGV